MDLKLEVVIVPVSDVDRAKQFYTGLGWREDADIAGGPGFRIVQITPPGSGCSISCGTGVTTMTPGSQQGPDPEGGSYQSHAVFSDPDGNGWVLQEVTTSRAWWTAPRCPWRSSAAGPRRSSSSGS